jgi:transcriptional regulator with XRE-family HTH domain
VFTNGYLSSVGGWNRELMAGNIGLQELAEAIDAQGSRRDFARKTGIAAPYLSMILSGKRPLSRLPFQTILRLSEHTGIPADRFAEVANNRARKRAGR